MVAEHTQIQSGSTARPSATMGVGRVIDAIVTIRTERRGGIWRVTRDHVFHGDYVQPGPALDAAVAVARELQRKGGAAQIVFDQTAVT